MSEDCERLQIHDYDRSENRKSLKQQRRSASSSKLKRLEVPLWKAPKKVGSDSASTSNPLQKVHTLYCLVSCIPLSCRDGKLPEGQPKAGIRAQEKTGRGAERNRLSFCTSTRLKFEQRDFFALKNVALKEEARRLADEAKLAEERRKAEEEKRRKDEAC